MIGRSLIHLLNGSRVVPVDFTGNHFKGTPVPAQAKHIVSHDMLGCRWWEINTSAGVYNWTTLDAKIAAYGSGSWTYCCFGTPTWASARPTEPHIYGPGRMAEPASMASLGNFVTALVTRYPTLTHVELWNEPDIPNTEPLYWYSGTVAKFVDMAQAIYNAAKAVRPAIKVIGPSSVLYLSAPNWLDAFFSAGGASYIDEASIHGYQLQWDTPHKALLGTMLNLDYLLKAASKAGISKPINITEFGQINPIPGALSDDVLIAGYRRAILAAAATGIKLASWYQYDDSTFGYFERPAVVAAVAQFVATLPGSTIEDVRLEVSGQGLRVLGRINGVAYEF